MEQWHGYVIGGAVAVALFVWRIAQPVIAKWGKALERQADAFYKSSKLPVHSDKQAEAMENLGQTWSARIAPKRLTINIKPGESERPKEK